MIDVVVDERPDDDLVGSRARLAADLRLLDEPAMIRNEAGELLAVYDVVDARVMGAVREALATVEYVRGIRSGGMLGPFTSGIVNNNNALPYHRDAGNFRGSWNVMVTLREHLAGGELVVPSLGVAFGCADASVAIFDAQARVHGVTPLTRERRGGYRRSVVFYALTALSNCGCRDDEVRRARRVRTEREDRRGGLIE